MERKPVVHLDMQEGLFLIERRETMPGLPYESRVVYMGADGRVQVAHETSEDELLGLLEEDGKPRDLGTERNDGTVWESVAAEGRSEGTLEVLLMTRGFAPLRKVYAAGEAPGHEAVRRLGSPPTGGSLKEGTRWVRALPLEKEQVDWMEEAGKIGLALDKVLANAPELGEALRAPGRLIQVATEADPLGHLPTHCRDGSTAVLRHGDSVYQIRTLTFAGPKDSTPPTSTQRTEQ